MLKITLDNNCLVSLKNKDAEHAEIRTLVDLHPNQIAVYIPAIAASENQQSGVPRTSFAQFQEFLAEIDCEQCELLMPMLYLDICYLDYAIPADEEMAAIEQRIHDILFPNIPFIYSEYCKSSGFESDDAITAQKWIRAKCDVQAIWCHIRSKNDIFVSQDNNFHKRTKKPKLVALGAQEILRPSECLSRLTRVTEA